MKFNLLKEKEMGLLNRKRVTFLAEFPESGTPSNDAIIAEISKKLKVDEEVITIQHIYQKFGKREAKIISHIYKSKEDKEKIEKINKKPKKEEDKK